MMISSSISAESPRFGSRSLLTGALALIIGSSLLWASATVQVPFWPVPMTMQSFVVLTIGAVLGPRLGTATVAAYLLEGAVGLPVFAGTPANGIGLPYMAGPTGGYLAGYLAAAFIAGLLFARGAGRSLLTSLAALFCAEAAILALGCAWLAVLMGWDKALQFGFGPFLVGDAFKLVLAAVAIMAARRLGFGAGETTRF